MKTPWDVGKYRLKIIRNLLNEKITKEAAIELQKMKDAELTHMIRKERANVQQF